MSEFEDDIDDQLLELAGASEGRERRKHKGSKSSRPSKKRKVESDSERDLESEDDASDSGNDDPYPYEGQYIDAKDKEYLLSLPEIKREEILAERSEEKRRLQEKRLLAQMVKAQKGSGGMAGLDDDSVARAAKRQHTARGATKEKSRKLDELKAKRKAKGELMSTKRRDRSASPQDMDISSDESEDGIITRDEQQEERDRRLLGLSSSNSRDDPENQTLATLEDFNRCRLTRDLAEKWCLHPWFKEYVVGSWVRYLVGSDGNTPVYRICEIVDLVAQDPVKTYKLGNRTYDRAVELKHGQSIKQFNMDRISNSHFTPREFDRLVQVCKTENVPFPTRRSLLKKDEQMRKLQSTPLTDKDITAMLERRKELEKVVDTKKLMGDRSDLKKRVDLLRKGVQDSDSLAQIAALESQIAALTAQIDSVTGGDGVEDSKEEVLRKVNERNRKANLEAIRKAELAEVERKRREREVAAKMAASGGVGAAAAMAVKHDPSARLKTVPRLFTAATPTTRPTTPANASKPSTPANDNQVPAKPTTVSSTIAFEQKLLDTIEIDLGDF